MKKWFLHTSLFFKSHPNTLSHDFWVLVGNAFNSAVVNCLTLTFRGTAAVCAFLWWEFGPLSRWADYKVISAIWWTELCCLSGILCWDFFAAASRLGQVQGVVVAASRTSSRIGVCRCSSSCILLHLKVINSSHEQCLSVESTLSLQSSSTSAGIIRHTFLMICLLTSSSLRHWVAMEILLPLATAFPIFFLNGVRQ